MSYLNDPTRFVADLKAAAHSGNWEQYSTIQNLLGLEATLRALKQVEQQKQEAEEDKES